MTKTIKVLKFSIVTDEKDSRGITSIQTRDHRGYWLNSHRYGGKGWYTRIDAIKAALSVAR